MPVPLFDIMAQNGPLRADLTAAFERVLDHGRFVMGPEIDELEAAIAELLGTAHAIGVSSGTDALLIALMALGIGPGDEVICPAFTFFASAGAIARTGAVPVFCDVCPVCFNIDAASARAKVSPRTKAIMPVHLFGQSADMEPVLELAREHELAVVEDAAQSIAARYRGQACGTIGDIGAFSFFPTKNLGALGDAGMVVTRDERLAGILRSLRNHGMEPRYYHHRLGGNFRIDTLQAAFLLVKLRHLDAYTDGRRRNAERYLERLGALDGCVPADPAHCKCASRQAAALDDSGARLVLPAAYPHNVHVWNQFTLRVIGKGRRDALRRFLADRGIGSEVYYPLTMDQQPCFATLPEASRRDLPVASRLAGEVVSLPVYPELPASAIDEVALGIADFLASESSDS